MKCLYEGDFTSVSGYARAARAHAKALIETGVAVYISNRRKDKILCELDPFWNKKLSEPSTTKADVKIWHETPEFYDPTPEMKNIALLAWETNKIPSTDIQNNPKFNWVKQLNKMDEVWVPCTDNRRALISSGVTVNIEVVPHPISIPEVTEPLVPKKDLLNIVSVFQWFPRKDPQSLLLGFYGLDIPAQLVLKTYINDFTEGQSHIVKVISDLKKSYHVERKNVIYPLLNQLSDEEMSRVHMSGDVAVSTSRGEGFNLPIVEAMALGIPVIVPGHTAFLDFVDESCGYLVDCIEQPVHGMAPIPWYSPDQRWSQVVVDNLIDKFKEAALDKKSGKLQEKGAAAKKRVEEYFSPSKIGLQMKKLLERVVG